MDNFVSTNDNDPEHPDEAWSAAPGEPELEALEGEVFRPRERREETVEREKPGVSAEAETEGGETARQQESVERGLAQYVFVREEREREVRLLFRDASPADLARTFRSAGAHLITLSAERASTPGSPISTPPPEEREEDGEEVETGERPRKHRGVRQRSSRPGPPTGEVLLRYFYALGEIVYTVSIVSPTGVVASVANTYPLAARSEHDLTERLAVVFL